MELLVEQDHDRALFVITGAIDERGAADLKERFKELDTRSIQRVILDFSQVTHIGSAGVGKLLLFYKELSTHGGEIRISNAPPHIRELFSELNLNSLFTIT